MSDKLTKKQKENIRIYEKWRQKSKEVFPKYKMPEITIQEPHEMHLCGHVSNIDEVMRGNVKPGNWIPSETIKKAFSNRKSEGRAFGWFDDLSLPENPAMDKHGYVRGLTATIEPHTKFMLDVIAGKVELANGLVASENQMLEKTPKYDNYYSKPLKSYDGKIQRKAFSNASKTKPGLVLKLSGDYDKERLRDLHNYHAVVIEIIDKYHYRIIVENGEEMVIRDTDVKWWIADMKHKFSKINNEDHKEVKTMIKKYCS